MSKNRTSGSISGTRHPCVELSGEKQDYKTFEAFTGEHVSVTFCFFKYTISFHSWINSTNTFLQLSINNHLTEKVVIYSSSWP